MNNEYLIWFMNKFEFPNESKNELLKCYEKLYNFSLTTEFERAIRFYYKNSFNWEIVSPLLQKIERRSEIHRFTIDILFIIQCSKILRDSYIMDGLEKIFFDTIEDIRYKLLECKQIHNIWGTFCASWYSMFFSKDFVRLGRLQYENCKYDRSIPFAKAGIIIDKGDDVKSIHIPSNEPLDQLSCIDSLKLAYKYFENDLNYGLLICICNSWVIHPAIRKILYENSNIRKFNQNFEIVDYCDEGKFSDSWRIFGKDYTNVTADLPEFTSLQRVIKKRLLSGEKMGIGNGILIFNGVQIIT